MRFPGKMGNHANYSSRLPLLISGGLLPVDRASFLHKIQSFPSFPTVEEAYEDFSAKA